MLNLQLARKYSGAVFELAKEEGKLVEYGEELSGAARDIKKVEGLMAFLMNPQVEVKAKKELLIKLFDGELSPTVFHFLLLLNDKRRMGLIEAIAEDYRRLSYEAQGIIIAEVTTASPLGEAQAAALKAKLAEVSGKKVELRPHIDESIIGGVVVRIGDRRLDGSVAGRLKGLTQELMAK